MKKSKIKVQPLTRSKKIQFTKAYHEAVDPLVSYLTEPQPEWDEVVEDGAYLSFNTVVELDQNNLNEILAHRLDLIKDELTPVRIKCRKGCIQIERVK